MAHAMDSCYVISVDYSSGNKFATVKRQLHFQCTELKDANGDGTGQPFLTGGSHDGVLPDGLKSTSPIGDGVGEKSNTLSTSIGRKLLRTFPRTFGKVQWINLKKEAQFHCFLGYQRQFPYLGGVTKPENVGISAFALLGFQIAAAPNMPMIVNRISIEPHTSSEAPPPLQATRTVPDPFVKETEDTNSSEVVESSLPSPRPRSETINESQSSPALEAWFHDFNLDPSGIPPGPFRSQQIARKKKETNEMLGNIDQLLSSSLENLNLNEGPDECPKFETLGTGYRQTSPGGRNQSGSGGKNSSTPENPSTTPNSNNDSGQGKKKRSRDNSNDGDESHPGKPPRKKPGQTAGEEVGVPCTYYENETDQEAKEGHKCKGLLFTTHKELCEHIQGVHLKPEQCPRCFTRYGRKRELNRHTRGNTCHPPETVKDYVLEFNKKVLSSTEYTLHDILYVKGKKQYDYLDCTDKLRSSQDAALEEEAINGELMKTLSPRSTGNPFRVDSPVASHRDPKASMSKNGESALALFVREFKLAEQSDDEAAVEQLVQQLIDGLSPTARLVVGYALERKKKATTLGKSVVGDTPVPPRSQPPITIGWPVMTGVNDDYSQAIYGNSSSSSVLFGSDIDSGIAPSQLGDYCSASLKPSELAQQGLGDDYTDADDFQSKYVNGNWGDT